MTTMPVITIRQPWPHAILHLGKNIENRSWPTKHRGPILIHAGKAMTKKDMAALVVIADPIGLDLSYWDIRLRTHGLRGGIVGVVTVVDCVQNHPSPWAIPGHWHWVLADARPLPFQACKGRLGIWRVETPEGMAV